MFKFLCFLAAWTLAVCAGLTIHPDVGQILGSFFGSLAFVLGAHLDGDL